MGSVVFYAFAALTLLFTAGVVLSPRPVYSAVSMAAAFFCTGAIYVYQGAFAAGAIQVLVYAGAVMVLFLFVLMLLNPDKPAPDEVRLGRLGTLLGVAWLGLATSTIWGAAWIHDLAAAPEPPRDGIAALARVLFTRYLVPFEAVSLLILGAILGTVILARGKLRGEGGDEQMRAEHEEERRAAPGPGHEGEEAPVGAGAHGGEH